MTTTDYPGVITSFSYLESSLADFLKEVPYCTKHLRVWSPRLGTILTDAQAQLDSLWYQQSRQIPSIPPKMSIVSYYRIFAKHLKPQWVVFWSDPPARIVPFARWKKRIKKIGTTKGDSGAPPWWKASNDLKHNRIVNRQQASYKNAVQALAALFLGIINCDGCWSMVQQAGWVVPGLSGGPYEKLPPNSTGDDRHIAILTVESKLFTFACPFGYRARGHKEIYYGRCSPRFRAWNWEKR